MNFNPAFVPDSGRARINRARSEAEFAFERLGMHYPSWRHDRVIGFDPVREVQAQGHAMRFFFGAAETVRPPTRGDRKAISGFSNASKRALADVLASLEEQSIHFVTLTYPPECVSRNPQIWKEEIEQFYKRLKRRYPQFAFIWRLEKQKNGNPHYHLLVFNVDLTGENRLVKSAEFFGAVIEAWQGITNDRTIPHIVPMENKIGGYLYICGHAGKANQIFSGQNVGRYWGIKGRQNLRFAPMAGGIPSVQVLRLARRKWKSQETARVLWLKSRGRKGKRRKFKTSGKYFFRVPLQLLLEKSGIPRERWFMQPDAPEYREPEPVLTDRQLRIREIIKKNRENLKK